MAEDARIVAAREYLVEKKYTRGYRIAGDLLAYAEERLRVNVGLVAENAQLKKNVGEMPALTLESVPTSVLLREIERRMT